MMIHSWAARRPIGKGPGAFVPGLCALGMALSTLAPTQARASDPVTVRFVYVWPVPDINLVPVVVGQKLGFYRRHGINVTIMFPPDAQSTARMVATNRADIGFEATTDPVFAANQGVPVISIANFTQSNSWCLAGRPGEPVDISKLRGKRIGIFTDSWSTAMMGFVLRKANLRNTDVRQIIAQNDDIALLLAGKIDIASGAASYAYAQIGDHLRKKPSIACNAAIGVPNIPVWSYTSSPGWLAANGATARAWLSGTAEAIQWSIAHPSEAAAILTKAYPESGSQNYNTIGWTYTARLMNGPNGYFKQTDQQWTVLAKELKIMGQISSVKLPSMYYTNAYLTH